jgi:hypothetical protein
VRTLVKVGVPQKAYFQVFDSSRNPVLGLTTVDFTTLLAKDGANSGIAVTITEISQGRYYAEFTPNAAGTWFLSVRHGTHGKKGWQETFEATADGPITLAMLTAELLDKANSVDGYTVREAFKLFGAAIVGKCSGEPNNPVTFRSMNDAADRIQVTVDGNGNRLTVVLTP